MRYTITIRDENHELVQKESTIRALCEVDTPCQGIERSEYDTIWAMVYLPKSFLLCSDFMDEFHEVLKGMEWDAKHSGVV